MTVRQTIFTLITVLMLSIGQILFKYASERIDIQGQGVIMGLLLKPTFVLALIIYGVATILWLLVLKTTPLRMAYPFVALAFVVVPIFSFIFLGEELRWGSIIGAAVIILGVYISLM